MMLLKKRKRSSLDILIASQPMQMSVSQRAAMTISCADTKELPKVPAAGKIIEENNKKVQIMHNGLKVLAGGYYGELIEGVISELKGHHEPQEEKVFYYILQRIKRNNPKMIELGSFWAYYSLWFKEATKNGVAICCEPDPKNIEVGKANMRLNNFKEGDKLFFHQAAAGSRDGHVIEFRQDSDQTKVVKVPIRSVDALCSEHTVDKLDILHIDAQGVELEALQGASTIIDQGKLRFVVVSTHHYVFSNDPLTHQKCEKFIVEHGGHIIASHSVVESFSGDGLIVASFDKQDKDFHVDISINSGPALFRPYEEDLSVLMGAYDNRRVG